jgi:hypothetical protein
MTGGNVQSNKMGNKDGKLITRRFSLSSEISVEYCCFVNFPGARSLSTKYHATGKMSKNG